MKAYSFSGRYAIVTDWLRCLKVIALLVLAGASSMAVAEPVGEMPLDIEALITGPVQNWIQGVDGTNIETFDPQIFTEISPLQDSPQGVRLPADQIPVE